MGIAAYPDHLSFVLFALLAPFSPFLTTIVFKKNVGGAVPQDLDFRVSLQLSFHGKSLWLSMAFAKIFYVLITDWRPI
jgi:hypothetical protein